MDYRNVWRSSYWYFLLIQLSCITYDNIVVRYVEQVHISITHCVLQL